MTKIMYFYFVLFLLNVKSSFVLCSLNNNNTDFDKEVISLEKLIKEFISKNALPSVVMGLSVNGLTKYREAFGFADLENAVSATIQTHYRQASISKTFTSAILAEIVDKKLANFDDALNKHLNFSIFPQKTWKSQPVKITLRQLLSHTAGLYSTKDNEEFAIVKEYHNLTEYIAKHKNKPLLFEPGHGYSYSNYGFQVVGAVIEAITGQSFLKVMTDFLKRHHLDETSLETRQSLIRNAAQYYYFKKDHFYENIPAPLYDDLVIAESNWASGGLVSTVDDLLKWGNFFIDSFKGKNNCMFVFGKYFKN